MFPVISSTDAGNVIAKSPVTIISLTAASWGFVKLNVVAPVIVMLNMSASSKLQVATPDEGVTV